MENDNELNILHELKEENQFYLFNRLVMDKELYSNLRDDIKESVFNVIKDGMSNPSYKILYIVLASDLSVSIKRSCLLWVKEGVCTLEQLDVKLKWLSQYEEFRDYVLEKFYKLENEFDNLECSKRKLKTNH